MQMGIAIEALAYLELVRDGLSASKANGTPMSARAERAARLAGRHFSSLAGGDVPMWAQAFSDAYNGVKHVNRPMPDAYSARVHYMLSWVLLMMATSRLLNCPDHLRARISARPDVKDIAGQYLSLVGHSGAPDA
jgi:hypothetical protein